MANLVSRLNACVAAAEETMRSIYQDELNEIGNDLREICRGKVVRRKPRRFDPLLHCAEVLDAVEVIRECWQQSETKDFSLSGMAAGKRKSFFRGIFEDGHAPDRGLVYVTWTHKPEVYYYVGKTTDSGRVIREHPKLTQGLTTASTLSFLYPYRSTNPALLDLESSVIQVLLVTGKFPEHNEAMGRIPKRRGSQMLQELTNELKWYVGQMAP